MASQVYLDHPGLFVARRPLLSVIIVIAVLALVGFNGGALLSSEIRTFLLGQTEGFFKVCLVVAVALVIPAISPVSHWGRVLIAGGFSAAGGLLIFLSSGLGAVQSDISLLVVMMLMVLAATALIMMRPMTGRGMPLVAIVSPFLGLVGLISVAAYLSRLNIAQGSTMLALLSLGLCSGIFGGVLFAARFVQLAREENTSAQLAAGMTLNHKLRDLTFWAIAAGLVFTFYPIGDESFDPGLRLSWLAPLIIVIAVLPVVTGLTAISAFGGHSSFRTSSDDTVLHNNYIMLTRVLRKTNRAGLLSAFFISGILAVVFFIEAQTGLGNPAGDAGAIFLGQIIFYFLIFTLTAVLYLSLRMGALAASTFLITDLVTAGIVTPFFTGSPNDFGLVDIVPRFVVLVLIISVAKSWSTALHDNKVQRYQIPKALARSAAPALLALLCCVCALSGFALIETDMQSEVSYMTLRLFVQGGVALLFLPAGMSALSRLRFTL